ncbi:putative pentatricopeptide repeat-containing protein At1g10330 [Beta vulgaris subsp. vulgaris]|uniref:putative pentatricopeptide repeat-containing protein At1g10330 n=1 Tax=Beta vulgaris subsp. vulgaris TaxID=3555 RepID=UPI000900FA3C|nr:putative pentatricopeptide repeat-containing protein At1g10330 [Beta vulgaris subsp. vulgaris]
MFYTSEQLLQLLQHYTKNTNKIKQVQALSITNGYLQFNPADASKLKWMSTLLFNALIRCYLNVGQPNKSMLLLTHMLAHRAPPNKFTFTSLIKAVSSSSLLLSFIVGRSLHSHVIRRGLALDPFIQTSFVSFYGKHGSFSEAQLVFEEILEPCIVSHNVMLDVFAKYGDMDSSVLLFEQMCKRDVFSWTSLIHGFGSNGFFLSAIRYFEKMMVDDDVISGVVRPNEATFVSVLSACENLDAGKTLCLGKQLHGYIVKNEIALTVYIGTALISFYGKLGCLISAMKVFGQMETKEVCTWNAMILSCALNGREQLALDIFKRMQQEKIWPNEVTYVAVLTACTRAKFVKLGLELFRSMSQEYGIFPRMEHYGCVVDLLGRAGFLVEAENFVKEMPFEPDDTVLGALLGACKLHGALDLGDKVGGRLFGLQTRHSGKYIALWDINASAEKWNSAADLRQVMVDAGIRKVEAFSFVDPQ